VGGSKSVVTITRLHAGKTCDKEAPPLPIEARGCPAYQGVGLHNSQEGLCTRRAQGVARHVQLGEAGGVGACQQGSHWPHGAIRKASKGQGDSVAARRRHYAAAAHQLGHVVHPSV
jgi:hypothetical protein